MKNKQKYYLVTLFLVFFLTSLVLLIIYYTSTKNNVERKKSTIVSSILESSSKDNPNGVYIKTNTKGSSFSTSDTFVYQLPVKILTQPITEDDLYKTEVIPFGDLSTQFILYLGPVDGKISIGRCTFNAKGEITSTVSWQSRNTSEIIDQFKVGSNYLLRLEYPINPVGDQIDYAKNLKEKIADIERGKQINFLFARSVCYE